MFKNKKRKNNLPIVMGLCLAAYISGGMPGLVVMGLIGIAFNID